MLKKSFVYGVFRPLSKAAEKTNWPVAFVDFCCVCLSQR